ncbi:hypothetical protein IGB42_04188 [Andreprevotia sp. IGB-42]|uniref:hypothetical protein n=1 Tax=Andreprevotia sp. IGB-42 TaxID=2497473 RepID=UPI00135B9499|nr:hypothetical protein [Andreprevotia sp. IGB-42]KAF0811351.1 hypothetical protein IGB42_04188 [Andreprevotia sp. IGB-42]
MTTDPAPTHLLAFPRHCPHCGHGYTTFSHYLKETGALPGPAAEPQPGMVETRRLCSCGHTLAACFSDRRGNGTPPLRAQFEEVLDTLATLGLPQHDVRIELRKVLNGDPGELLERIYQAAA